MRDVIAEVRRLRAAGETFALATVVQTWRSAPRQPGASMIVPGSGEPVGSVSGGCVEGAVYELAHEVLRTGEPVLQRYGVTDGDAFEVGLTCGGILDVFVERVTPESWPELDQVLDASDADAPIAVVTVVAGPGRVGTHLVVTPAGGDGHLGSLRLDAAVTDDARGMLESGVTGTLHIGPDGERRLDDLTVFVESFAPAPQMYVFGAIDFAAAVARIGKFLGYRVTVCDARPVFATRKRFPDADQVVVEWPHRFLAGAEVDDRTVICVLTHDPKFDVPLLDVALRTKAAYIGVMGSRRTHDDRLARLREAGVTEELLARMSSPIGLDIGARTPEETAVSIAAEIVASRWGGTGQALRETTGPIHVER